MIKMFIYNKTSVSWGLCFQKLNGKGFENENPLEFHYLNKSWLSVSPVFHLSCQTTQEVFLLSFFFYSIFLRRRKTGKVAHNWFAFWLSLLMVSQFNFLSRTTSNQKKRVCSERLIFNNTNMICVAFQSTTQK